MSVYNTEPDEVKTPFTFYAPGDRVRVVEGKYDGRTGGVSYVCASDRGIAITVILDPLLHPQSASERKRKPKPGVKEIFGPNDIRKIEALF